MDERPPTRTRLRPVAALTTGALALVDLIAVVVIVAWAVGRLVSDAFEWSQWLSWIPTLAMLPVAMLGLAAAARPAPARPPARLRRMLVWTAVVVGLAVHLVVVDHRLVLSRCDGAADGTSVVHWNMTARRRVPVRTLADVLIREDADLTIMTNPPLLFGDPAFRAWTEGRAAQIVEPFGVVTTLGVRRFRPLIAAEGIHVALLELDAPRGFENGTLVVWLMDLPSDPRRSRRAIAERARALIGQVDAPSPDLIVGDLNMVRGSRSMRRLAPDHVNAFDLAGAGIGASFPRRWPLHHIDHVLVRPTLPVACYRLEDPGVGKHRLQRLVLRAADPGPRRAAARGAPRQVSSSAVRSAPRGRGSSRTPSGR